MFSMLERALTRTEILSLSSANERDALKVDVRKPAFVSTYAPASESYVHEPALDRPVGGPQLQSEDDPLEKSNSLCDGDEGSSRGGDGGFGGGGDGGFGGGGELGGGEGGEGGGGGGASIHADGGPSAPFGHGYQV